MGFTNIDLSNVPEDYWGFYDNFDPSLPDPVVPEDGCYIHYNVFKISLHHWDGFNKNGHGALMHQLGNIENDFESNSYYAPIIKDKLTLNEWANLKLMIIVNTLWYQERLRVPFVPEDESDGDWEVLKEYVLEEKFTLDELGLTKEAKDRFIVRLLKLANKINSEPHNPNSAISNSVGS